MTNSVVTPIDESDLGARLLIVMRMLHPRSIARYESSVWYHNKIQDCSVAIPEWVCVGNEMSKCARTIRDPVLSGDTKYCCCCSCCCGHRYLWGLASQGEVCGIGVGARRFLSPSARSRTVSRPIGLVTISVSYRLVHVKKTKLIPR